MYLHMIEGRDRKETLSCSSYKGINFVYESSNFMTYLPEALSPNTYWGLSFIICILGEHKYSIHNIGDHMTICYEQSIHNRGSLTPKIDVLFTYKIYLFHPTTPNVLTHSSIKSIM